MDTNNQSPLAPETQLDHYKIIKTLGQGGFGITYLAMDQNENRPVVIKEYFPSDLSIRTAQQTQLSLLTSSKRNDFNEGKARFKREAVTLGEFNHPNIVKVQLYFEANGTAYFVMEYAEGQSVEAYQESLGRPLNESELQKNVFPILKGLSAVHNKKLLHLDIKPGNILKTEYGEPLLIDFGGARIDTAKASKAISQHSSMVGTSGYSPPEQYSQDAKQTAETDFYAFGMTLYALMAPSEPIPDSLYRQTQVLQEELADPLKPIRAVARGYSEALYQAVESCIALRQKSRPQTVAELNEILKLSATTEKPKTERSKSKETETKGPNSERNADSCFKNGEGFYKAQNFVEAATWYTKAANQGHAQAQNNLGYLYRHGKGVTQSYQNATKWFEKAAHQGHAGAQNNLAYSYETGQGVEQSFIEAKGWYEKAALRGNANAQYNLGDIYEHGIGVSKDNDQAVAWYCNAADQGHDEAKQALKRLAAGSNNQNNNSSSKINLRTLRDDEIRYKSNWCSPTFYYWVSILIMLIGISLRIVFDTWPSGFTGLDTAWTVKALVAFPWFVYCGSILLDKYKNKISFVKFFPISTTMMAHHFLCINVAAIVLRGFRYLLSLLFGKNVEMDIFGLSNIIPAEEYFAFLIIFILMHHTKLAKKIENSDLFQSGFSTSNPVIFTIFFGVSCFVMDKYI